MPQTEPPLKLVAVSAAVCRAGDGGLNFYVRRVGGAVQVSAEVITETSDVATITLPRVSPTLAVALGHALIEAATGRPVKVLAADTDGAP